MEWHVVIDCPPEFFSLESRADREGSAATDENGSITVHSLAKLRSRLRAAVHLYRMAQAKVDGARAKAIRLEDIVNAKVEK